MMIEVIVPRLSESAAEATLSAWHVKEGETVARNQILIDIETDKVVLELLAPEAGVIVNIIKGKGETVTSGVVIAQIDTGVRVPAAAAYATHQTPNSLNAIKKTRINIEALTERAPRLLYKIVDRAPPEGLAPDLLRRVIANTDIFTKKERNALLQLDEEALTTIGREIALIQQAPTTQHMRQARSTALLNQPSEADRMRQAAIGLQRQQVELTRKQVEETTALKDKTEKLQYQQVELARKQVEATTALKDKAEKVERYLKHGW